MGTSAVAVPPSVWGLLGCCFLCDWALGGPQPLRSLPPLSSQVKPGSEPRWVPQEGAEAALAFLYSGDAQQLSGANCTERYEAQGAGAQSGPPPVLWKAGVTLAQTANFLNMLLQANDIRESSVEEDMEWYQAIVRSVAEGDQRAYRALLTFNPPPGASRLQLALQATRMGEEIVLQDLSRDRLQEESPAVGPGTPALQKRVLINDLGSLGSPKWPRGDSYVGDVRHVRLSPPFLECQEGRLRPGWLITLSATFYGLKPDLSPEARGQVQMDIDLQSVDVNQCASGPGWYSNTHLCDPNSTQCIALEGRGFVLGRYLCRCRPGFYGTSHSGGSEEGTTQPTGQLGSLRSSTERLLRCRPCPEGCASCLSTTPCLVEEALVLRVLVLACQACCVLAIVLSMLLSYRCRRRKRIRASGIVLLETILFGSLLLYFPVFILYLKPSIFCCIALRWVRLLGFAIVYGTIVLKLYRVLQMFLSRTAQRGPPLSSGRLLRRLGLLLLLVLGFLVVWTAGVLEQGQHTPLVTQGHTPAGRRFYLCHHGHWDYIMVVVEMLLLCWGSFLCYAARAVPSALHEPRHLGIALHKELLLSAAFHVARFVLVPSLHPDWTLLLFFFHTHSTVTATLALIFVPKFRKPGAPSREEMVGEAYEDQLDLQCSGSYLNSSVTSAWSERSLDPGDIRDELKKLYAQLEVHKTKEMAANNPHLPKKRGSSGQGLGRSLMRCLAEVPEALVRQHSRDSGSPGHSSLPGSSLHRLLSSSLQEPQWKPALCKSRSTYEHDHGRDPPLLDSLLRRKPAKKASRGSRESVEEPPVLGFKSASAHNLTVGGKLPRAPLTSLQKSLSVMAGSREKALMVAGQAYLEETYRQAKEPEERKTAEVAMASPVQRPSARRLVQSPWAPLSAPPSPAKSSSGDSPPPSGKLQENNVERRPPPPTQHQVSTPILALSGPCLGEPCMLPPTSTLAPALMSVPAPVPTLAPRPAPAHGPSILTYICPWENAEIKKENVAPEGPSEPERGKPSLAPGRARLWRALSTAPEKRGGGESGVHTADLQTKEDRPKIICKSHSLKTPAQQRSVHSLGLAIRALARSRSAYREKESGEGSPKGEKGRAPGEGIKPCSPRPGQPRAVSKQTALAPCHDEESLQNRQNAHTSRMLQVCHHEGSREREDRGRRTLRSAGKEKAERAVRAGPAPLRGTVGDRNAEGAGAAPMGGQELPRSGRQPLGSADSCVVEVCPWEAAESGTCLPDSSNKAEICPWEVSEGTPELKALRQDLQDSQDERRKAPEKSQPKDVAVIARKRPERLVRGQEAVCPWEKAGPEDPLASDRAMGRPGTGRSVEAREAENVGPSQQTLKTFFCKDQKSGGDLEFLCPWDRTDFQGSSILSTQALGAAGYPGRLSSSVVEVCLWEAGDTRADKRADICPWELGGKVAGKEACDGAGGESLQVAGCSGEPAEQTGKAAQELSQQQGSVRPWGDTAPGHPSPRPDNASARTGGLSQGGSRSTQGCPQENLRPGVTPARAEICPWEVGERTREDRTSRWAPGEDSQEGQEKMPGTLGIKDATTGEKTEGQIQKQEAVCPWESVDPDSFSPPRAQGREHPKVSFRAWGSVGSKTAEICPWDMEETLPAEKAEICPWEAGAGAGEERALGGEAITKLPGHTGKAPAEPGPSEVAVTAPKEPERPAQEQEVGCPRERLAPAGCTPHSDTLDTGRPRAGLQELDCMGCRPAEVCPWEVGEAPTSEKAQTCPWDMSKETAGRGPEDGVGSDSAGWREKTLEKGRLTSLEDTSKWDTKQSQEQEAVGPWGEEPHARAPEVADLPSLNSRGDEGPCLEVSDEASEDGDPRRDPQTNGGTPEHTTREKAPPAKAGEVIAEDEKETSSQSQVHSVAPTGSLSSPDLRGPCPGETGPQRLPGAGGRVAQGCAVEVPVLNAPAPDCGARAETPHSDETERLPGRGVSTHHGVGGSPEKGNAPEKLGSKVVAVQEKPERAGRKQEAVCPQESRDCRGLSPQAAPQACARSSSEAADSMRARGVQVCPWEVEEAPFVRKAEICLWGASEGAETGGLEQDLDRQSQEQGGRCLQKAGSGGLEDTFRKKRPNQSLGSKQAGEQDGRAVSWEITDPEGNEIKHTMADTCPWEGLEPPLDSGLLALTATQTEVFSPTATEKPP
ncbi:PREDICTED: probable G-protein coupled receptor 179 [Condylura cristata]|uniref:probable G-protein coupled receptor 179 n=1 Tax=Condylura cristata TaxID=143302 RepID=UPI0003344B36|nr:PREDICTED: probable G-protein coupled receptor 179 [Condylura cristata]